MRILNSPEVGFWEVEPSGTQNSETLSQAFFTPVLAKHSKNFSIIDSLAIGVDRIQRNFDPLRQQVEAWLFTGNLEGSGAEVVIDAAVLTQKFH